MASAPTGTPITVAIERRVDPTRTKEVRIWAQAGMDLASQHAGYLGAGWIRSNDDSDVWYMLYRFTDATTLEDWEGSDDRRWWLSSGEELVRESRTEKRTGIEGWFDAEHATVLHGATPSAAAPPRWKQAVSIWLGFFPTNLAFTLVVSALFPPFTTVPIVVRVLVTTVILTPIMTYAVLPLVTRGLRPWLQRH